MPPKAPQYKVKPVMGKPEPKPPIKRVPKEDSTPAMKPASNPPPQPPIAEPVPRIVPKGRKRKRATELEPSASSTNANSTKIDVQRGKKLARDLVVNLSNLHDNATGPDVTQSWRIAKDLETVFFDLEDRIDDTSTTMKSLLETHIKKEINRVLKEVKEGTLVTGPAMGVIQTHIGAGNAELKKEVLGEAKKLGLQEFEASVKKGVRGAVMGLVEKRVEEERRRLGIGLKAARAQLAKDG